MADEFIRSRASSLNVRTRGPRRTGAAMVVTFGIDADGNTFPSPQATTEIQQYYNRRELPNVALPWPMPNELPIVNQSVFYWGGDNAADWRVYPWLICSDLRISRNPNKAGMFDVEATYSVPEHVEPGTLAVLQDVAIPATVDGYPYIQRSIWAEDEQNIYDEADYGTGAETLELRLPTGSYFSEPFRRKFPIRHMRQTQFENLPSEVNGVIEERLYTMQDRTYMGYPGPGSDMVSNRDSATPPRWLMNGIEYQEVLLPIAVGGNIELQNYYMMTYDVRYTLRDGGWYDRRALVDNFVLTSPNDLTTKIEYRSPKDGVTIIDALLEKNGLEKTADGGQTGSFRFNNYQEQPFGIWSYLKGTST